jgi:outer membrane protein
VKKQVIIALAAAMLLGGCASSNIGLLDIGRIISNWPTYQNYQAQLQIDEQTIAQKNESNAQKIKEANALQGKYGKITDDLTKQIRDAATKIANDRGLKLVVTKQGVGYGGVDITADVEKAMNITEKATPTP